MTTNPLARRLAAFACAVISAGAATAADWPQWRYDAGRTACSPEQLPSNLKLSWVRELPTPRPAWPPSQTKLLFDVSYEPVAAGRMLVVGSMCDDSLAAYHAATGQLAWRFVTDGPVRFAPVVEGGRVWAVSDDGWLYCLGLADGRLLGKFRGGLDGRKCIGNGRAVSLWPARGGPVLHQGRLYFAAGIWPFMGTFLYAIDPDTREAIWCNSSSGSRWTLQQHYAPAFAGVAPQGYLAADGNTLLVSGGRTVPAAFDADTGDFKYFHMATREVGRDSGGYDVAAADGRYYNSGQMHEVTGGSLMCLAGAAVIGQGEVYGVEKGKLFAAGTKLREVEYTDRRGNKATRPEPTPLWEHEYDVRVSRLFLRAGGRLYASAAGGAVVAVDLADPSKIAWRGKVDGEPWTMLAADGRLFVVTTAGTIFCFAGEDAQADADQPKRHVLAKPPARSAPAAGAGADLVRLTGIRDGWAVVLGADAELAESILAASEMELIVLDVDAEKVAALREHFGPRYGERVSAVATGLAEAKLPPYLASLVVAADGASPELLAEIARVLRPYGGAAWVRVGSSAPAWLANPPAGLTLDAAPAGKGGLVLRRQGPLPGAGNWTHQYADAGNSVVGSDKLVRAPLGILWFGGPSNDAILPRHGHGPTPQVVGGRLFIEGRNILRATDVYTGRLLWEARIKDLGKFYDNTGHQPGAGEIGSNYVSAPDGVYVITPKSCVMLDAATGKKAAEFHLPADLGRDAKWGFITVWDNYLIAAAAPAPEATDPNGLTPPRVPDYSASSRTMVAMDRHSGKLLWRRPAARSFRHNTIVAGGGRVYCIDGHSAFDRGSLRRRGEPVPDDSVLYALDAATGKVLWQTGNDAFGTWLGYSAENDVLLQAGSASVDRANDESRTGMAVYRADDGRLLWQDRRVAYTGPCMIRRREIITNSVPFGSGFAMDLLTGKRLTQTDPVTGRDIPWRYGRTYGCNTAVASEHLITFRSAAAGYVDLETSTATGNLGGFKSGCTSNLIPADGVLSAPDYTRTCTCSYQNQTSLAMVHMPDMEQWTFWNAGEDRLPSYYSQKNFDANMAEDAAAAAGPPAGPVTRIGVNLGAPGDRQNGDTYWLEFPAVGGHSPAMGVTLAGGKTYCHHSGLFAGSEAGGAEARALTFVGASGIVGARKVAILLDPRRSPPTRKFTVRLVFAEPDAKAEPGSRVFDVAIQGRRVLEAFDPATVAGGPRRVVVREFAGIDTAGSLCIGLTPARGEPILCGIEALAEPEE